MRTAALAPDVFAATKVGTCVHTVGKTSNPHKQYLRKLHIARVHVLEFKLPARGWKTRIRVMDLHSRVLDHSLLSASPSEFWDQTFCTSLFLPIFRHSALTYTFPTPQRSIRITSTDYIYPPYPPTHTHTHTQQHLAGQDLLTVQASHPYTTLGRTPLHEWSARRTDLYLTTHNIHKRQTSMPSAVFEPTNPASE